MKSCWGRKGLLALAAVLVAVATACEGGEQGPGAPSPEGTANGAGLQWTRIHDDADLVGPLTQYMHGVTAGGPGLVSIGMEVRNGAYDGAVWTSADGVAWTRVRGQEDVLGGEGEQVTHGVTAGGPGLVIVGWDSSSGDADAVVWTSVDGATWRRAPHDEAVLGGAADQRMTAVVAGGPGLVAVGMDGQGGDIDAAVWVSGNGVSWSRISHEEAIFGGEGAQRINGIVAARQGLVAVGDDSSGGDVDAAVWTSVGGRIWKRVRHDEAALGGEGEQIINAVAVGGPGLIAVGWESIGGDIDGAVWTSADGETWRRVPHDEAVFGGEDEQIMTAVKAQEGLTIAAGYGGKPLSYDGIVWTSTDGLNWKRTPDDAGVFGGDNEQHMNGVAAVGARIVVTGCDGTGQHFDSVVWVATAMGEGLSEAAGVAWAPARPSAAD